MARFCLAILLTLWSASAWSVEVAFLEYLHDGRPVQLEPGGRFSHVAIRVGDAWLNAYPHGGVHFTPSLKGYGHRIYRLAHPGVAEPSPEFVRYWLGKPFDRTYRWETPGATYCTRLVAEALSIPPTPMTFSSPQWQGQRDAPVGCLGLSPDELYQALLMRGFKPVPRSCKDFLI